VYRCNKKSLVLPAVLVALSLGCAAPEGQTPKGVNYFLSSRQELTELPRVVMIELAGDAGYPEVGPEMTQALARAVRQHNLFHVQTIPRDHPACRDLPLSGKEPLTIEQMAAFRKALGCRAVLIGLVHDYRPHPHMRMGLYFRLLDLDDGKLIWAVDHVWDTTDQALEPRLRDFFFDEMRSGYEPVDWRLALISPRAFRKFVAYEAAETLSVPRLDPDGWQLKGQVGESHRKFFVDLNNVKMSSRGP